MRCSSVCHPMSNKTMHGSCSPCDINVDESPLFPFACLLLLLLHTAVQNMLQPAGRKDCHVNLQRHSKQAAASMGQDCSPQQLLHPSHAALEDTHNCSILLADNSCSSITYNLLSALLQSQVVQQKGLEATTAVPGARPSQEAWAHLPMRRSLKPLEVQAR